jgi:hypothetical protein
MNGHVHRHHLQSSFFFSWFVFFLVKFTALLGQDHWDVSMLAYLLFFDLVREIKLWWERVHLCFYFCCCSINLETENRLKLFFLTHRTLCTVDKLYMHSEKLFNRPCWLIQPIVEKPQDLFILLNGLCKTKAAGIHAEVLGYIFPNIFVDLDELFVYVWDKGLEDANNYFFQWSGYFKIWMGFMPGDGSTCCS